MLHGRLARDGRLLWYGRVVVYNDFMNETLIARLSAWCATRPVRLGVLFGSQATGKTHAGSDVDFAVWPDAPLAPEQKLAWLVELQRAVNNDVSLVIVSPDLDPVLGMEIVRHGIVVFEAEPELWYRKRLDLWHSYTDAQPFLRAQREALKAFAAEVSRGT